MVNHVQPTTHPMMAKRFSSPIEASVHWDRCARSRTGTFSMVLPKHAVLFELFISLYIDVALGLVGGALPRPQVGVEVDGASATRFG